MEGPDVAVYSGREGSVLASCAVLLGGMVDFSIVSVGEVDGRLSEGRGMWISDAMLYDLA